MSMTRRRLLDDTFKKSVVGNPAIATDSLARMYPGIEMQGWTEQAKTTGAQLLDASKLKSTTIGNVTITNNGDGSFTVGGNGVVDTNIRYRYDFTREESLNLIKAGLLYQSGNGTWEPYTGGQPSPSPDYPQEIVSAGKYNEDTQKWEYEITIANKQTDPDKNQTVTLTADRPLTKWDRLEKRNGQWGWVYKSAEVVFDGSEKWSLYPSANVGTVFYTTLPNATLGLQTSLCDKYKNVNRIWDAIYNGALCIYSDNANSKSKYFRPPSAVVETVEQWKVWLSENPLTLLYETEVETFVSLTASEQEAMNALHTYRPTTVLSNQQDCEMALTYKSRKGMS